MKHSEILQIALDKHLVQSESDTEGRTRYICFALKQAVDGLPEQAIANKDEIVKHIMNCLHPTATVTYWLMQNNYVWIIPDELEREQIQLYRKRWMLHLIEEYKKQGK